MSAPTSQSSYIPRPRSSNPGVRPSAALTYTTAPSARTPRHHQHHHHNNGQQQPRPGDGGLPPRSGGGGSDGASLGPRRDFNNSARNNGGGSNAGTANSSSNLQASSSSSPGDLLSPSSPSSASGSSLSHSQQHPQFRGKMVCTLSCRHCANQVCSRGMKAILLGDLRVELYSTDSPPSKVQLVEHDYMTRNCRCRIRDVACLGCGNVIGYHVTQPCATCLSSCNNGHFWMFLADGVTSAARMDLSGMRPIVWAQLPNVEMDPSNGGGREGIYELLCR